MVEILSLVASLFMVAAAICYFLQVVVGASTPNPATWFISLLALTLSAGTYIGIMKENPIVGAASVIAALGVGVIFTYSLFRGKFAKIGWVEIASLAVVGIAAVLWWMSGPLAAHLILQAILAVGFIPTIVGLHRGRLREYPLAWLLGATSYCFMTAAVLVSWRGDWSTFLTPHGWGSLVSPVVDGLLGHGIVTLLALRGWKFSIPILSPCMR